MLLLLTYGIQLVSFLAIWVEDTFMYAMLILIIEQLLLS